MFSRARKAKQEADLSSELTEITDTTAPGTAPLPKSTAKMSGKKSASRASAVPSIISSDVIITGSIHAEGEVQLDGTLEGDISAQRLVVGDGAIVRGEIIAGSVRVSGTVEGFIRADTVELCACAHVKGDIVHTALSIETGARFEGHCRYSDNPRSEGAPSVPDAREGSEQGYGSGETPAKIPADPPAAIVAPQSRTDSPADELAAESNPGVTKLDIGTGNRSDYEDTGQIEPSPEPVEPANQLPEQENAPVQLKSSLGRVSGSLMKRQGNTKQLR